MGEVFTREEILAAEDSATRKELVPVKVPEWGGKTVYVRAMSSDDRDAFEDSVQGIDAINFRSRMVIATACDAEGHLLFKAEDAAAIGQKSVKPIQRIFNVAIKLNAITKEDIDELVKN